MVRTNSKNRFIMSPLPQTWNNWRFLFTAEAGFSECFAPFLKRSRIGDSWRPSNTSFWARRWKFYQPCHVVSPVPPSQPPISLPLPAWTSAKSWRWFRGTSSDIARQTGANWRSAGKRCAHAAVQVMYGEISQLSLRMNQSTHLPSPEACSAIVTCNQNRASHYLTSGGGSESLPLCQFLPFASSSWRLSGLIFILRRSPPHNPTIPWLLCAAQPRDGSLKWWYCHLVEAGFGFLFSNLLLIGCWIADVCLDEN